MMGKKQAEVRQAVPSATERLKTLVARLVQVELEVPAEVALVEPLASVDQTELLELLAALELVARPVPIPYAHRFACATQPISR